MKKNLLIAGALVAVLLISGSLIFLSDTTTKTTVVLNYLNDNLDAGGIRLGMPDHEVMELLGSGAYLHGFGGYVREYPDMGLLVSIPTDPDHDLCGGISHLEFHNPAYSIFGIRVGDDMRGAMSILKANRFHPSDHSPDTVLLGEFSIKLRGQDRIDAIQIWFDDKDLKDRLY